MIGSPSISESNAPARSFTESMVAIIDTSTFCPPPHLCRLSRAARTAMTPCSPV
jgi:hypothetical protein